MSGSFASNAFAAKSRPTPQAYFGESDVVQQLEAILNDCYAAQPRSAVRYISDRLRQSCAAPLIDEVRATQRADGYGGFALAIQLLLADGTTADYAVRLPVLPPHPTVVRETVSMPLQPLDRVGREEFIKTIATALQRVLPGTSVADQGSVDERILSADATGNWATFGSNVASAASLAAACVASRMLRRQLFSAIATMCGGAARGYAMPRPIFPLMGSGEHKALGRVRVVEIGFLPASGTPIRAAVAQATAIHTELVHKLYGAGDERQTPPLHADGTVRIPATADTMLAVVDAVEDAMRETGVAPGVSASGGGHVAVTVDGSWCYKPDLKKYAMIDGLPEVTGAQLAEQLATLCKERPAVAYLEDPLHPADEGEHKRRLMARVGATVSVASVATVGASESNARTAVSEAYCNTAGCVVEEMGTLSQLIAFRNTATRPSAAASSRGAGAAVAGDSDAAVPGTAFLLGTASPNAALADVAVGLQTTYFRAGCVVRGGAAEAYNRLADIEEWCVEHHQHREGPGSSASLHAAFPVPPPPAEPVVEAPTKPEKRKK